MLPLLGVGKDIEIFEREEAMWKKHGITLIRAYSMLEAIEKLVKTDFIFIAISSDRINYLPQLRIMRDLTYVPIIVVTSKFSAEDEVVALQSGADNYTLWRGTTQENVQSALAFIQGYTERISQHKKNIKILTNRNMLIAIDYRKVFVNDAEIILTRKEFDILCYLMVNRGRVLTYHQIFRRIWKEEYEEVSPQILWNVIKRLRKKIKAISGSTEYIENVREIGYRFAIEPDKLI